MLLVRLLLHLVVETVLQVHGMVGTALPVLLAGRLPGLAVFLALSAAVVPGLLLLVIGAMIAACMASAFLACLRLVFLVAFPVQALLVPSGATVSLCIRLPWSSALVFVTW